MVLLLPCPTVQMNLYANGFYLFLECLYDMNGCIWMVGYLNGCIHAVLYPRHMQIYYNMNLMFLIKQTVCHTVATNSTVG